MPVGHHTPTFTDLIPLATAEKICRDDYNRNRIIYVFVDQVIDANKIFARHISGYRIWKRRYQPLTNYQDLAKKAIQIRLYAVKCPSMRKTPPEPFAEEAKKFLEEKILHQVVRIKLLKKERDSNVAICQVETSKEATCYCLCRKKKMDLSQELCKAGYAELWTGGAPVLESYREFLTGKINVARHDRRGIWSLDEKWLSEEELKKKQKRQRSMRKLLSVKSLMEEENDHSNKSRRGLGGSSHHRSRRGLGGSSHHRSTRGGLGGGSSHHSSHHTRREKRRAKSKRNLDDGSSMDGSRDGSNEIKKNDDNDDNLDKGGKSDHTKDTEESNQENSPKATPKKRHVPLNDIDNSDTKENKNINAPKEIPLNDVINTNTNSNLDHNSNRKEIPLNDTRKEIPLNDTRKEVPLNETTTTTAAAAAAATPSPSIKVPLNDINDNDKNRSRTRSLSPTGGRSRSRSKSGDDRRGKSLSRSPTPSGGGNFRGGRRKNMKRGSSRKRLAGASNHSARGGMAYPDSDDHDSVTSFEDEQVDDL